MPSGRVHGAVTILLSLGLGYAAYRAAWSVSDLTALAAGSLAGLLLSPDLDVDGHSMSDKVARRGLGCFFGTLWHIYWRPYAAMVPHRSWVSHLPFISTFIRLVYLALPLLIWRWYTTGQIAMAMPPWLVLAYYGLAAADLLHWFMDTTIKGSQR
jgi:uncharacterized metal-binding protein